LYGIFAHIGDLGVDVELFRPLGLPKDDFVVSVGALNPQKGFDFLIRSLALLEKARRPVLMIVCNSADERERAYLTTLAEQLQVTVEFRSLIPDQELVRLYNRARLTAYAPVMEPFGFVPLESMACQTPVVGVREGGVRESVTDGVTGVLVDRETEAMAAAIRALLADPNKVDHLGHHGRAGVEDRWSWAASIEVIERYLVDTASSPGHGS
jgi:glycosyltransferase involved in cell wall biosynthesis